MRTNSREIITLAEDIARAWNENNIVYAVAHGLEDYPYALGRDLDVVVEYSQIDKALSLAAKVFQEHGWPIVTKPPGLYGKRIVAFNKSYESCLEIHTIDRLAWAVVTLVSTPKPSNYKGPFKIDPRISIVKRILMPLLAGDIRRFQEKRRELMLTEAEIDVMADLVKLLGERISGKLFEAGETYDVNVIVREIPAMKRRVLLFGLRKPVDLFRNFGRILVRRLFYVFYPCGPLVAVVGPDGVGKSTILNEIYKSDSCVFTGIQVRHWRPGLLPPLGALIHGRKAASEASPPRREPGRFKWLRVFYYVLDYWFGYMVKDAKASSRQQMILYDRSGLDMLIDPVRYGISSARGIKLLLKIIPKPDKTVLLYDTAERIYARKPELNKEEIHRQLNEWLMLYAEGKIDVIIRVNTTPEKIAHRLRDVIINAFIMKNGGFDYLKLNTLNWISEALGVSFAEATGTRSGFVQLMLPDGRGYLLPLDNARVFRRGLEIYPAQGWKGRLTRNLLAFLTSVGIKGPGFHKVGFEVKEKSVFQKLQEVFERDDLCFAISMGTPGPHRKPVVQVMTQEGEILGYVKVGWNDATRELVKHESKVLQDLRRELLPFGLPRVIYTNDDDKRSLCVQGPPPAGAHLDHGHLEETYLSVLRALADRGVHWEPLEETTFWQRIIACSQEVQNAFYQQILTKVIEMMKSRWIGKNVPFHFAHGDFAPWNALMTPEGLYLYDWEYSQAWAPAGYDLFHFLVQKAWLVEGKEAVQVVKTVRRLMRAPYTDIYWRQVGNAQADRESLFLLYLLDRFAFSLTAFSDDSNTLRFLSRLLLATEEEVQ